MLRIRQIRYYKLPKYPQGLYYECPSAFPWKVTGSIASLAMVALLLSSCKSGSEPTPTPAYTAGVVGPPPMPPDMVTEREARDVINEVFARNGINLEADVPFTLSIGDQSPIVLNLDGFNKDLSIGYEYIAGDDALSFTDEVVAQLDKASQSNGSGPYIKTIDEQYDDGEKSYEDIESIIQAFIDDLRSGGII